MLYDFSHNMRQIHLETADFVRGIIQTGPIRRKTVPTLNDFSHKVLKMRRKQTDSALEQGFPIAFIR